MRVLVLTHLLVLTIANSSGKSEPEKWDAIVVGAGFAGLSAADRLCDLGYNVTVLEARARLGGRAFTYELPVSRLNVEMGAGWLHNADPSTNPISRLAREFDIPLQAADDGSSATFLVNGTQASLVAGKYVRDWEACAEAFHAHLVESAATLPLSSSVQQVFDAWARARAITGLRLERCTYMVRHQYADLEFGATMSELSAALFDEGPDLAGEELMLAPAAGGFSRLVEALASRVVAGGRCRILVNAQVSAITLDHAGPTRGLSARLSSGQELRAAFAVVALPLGVLRAGAVAFSPALPAHRLDALQRLGVALLDKVTLLYSRPFWEADGPSGRAAWLEPLFGDSPGGGPALELWNAARFLRGRGAQAGALAEQPTAAVTLLVAADAARAMEAEPSDGVLARRADALFRSLWRDDGRGVAGGELLEWSVTRWGSDPFARGSFSFLPANATPADRGFVCAAQAEAALFWAGEHCARRSTVQAAFDSGALAATQAAAAFPLPLARSASLAAEAKAAAASSSTVGGSWRARALRAAGAVCAVAAAIAAAFATSASRRRRRIEAAAALRGAPASAQSGECL